MTKKQLAWIDYYKQGKTATEAARLAGYKAGSEKAFQNIGSENLAKLGQFVAERDKIMEAGRVADMEEINAFWTNTMRDENEKIQFRLRASELRAKAAGGFLVRVEADIKSEASDPVLPIEARGLILQALYGEGFCLPDGSGPGNDSNGQNDG